MYNSLIMSSKIFTDNLEQSFIPKPKINRLPLPATYKNESNRKMSDSSLIWKAIYSFWIISFLTLSIIISQYKISSPDQVIVTEDDVQLMNVVNSSNVPVKTDESKLSFKDGNEFIIGRMVKITPELDKISASGDDDYKINHDLMAILSKN